MASQLCLPIEPPTPHSIPSRTFMPVPTGRKKPPRKLLYELCVKLEPHYRPGHHVSSTKNIRSWQHATTDPSSRLRACLQVRPILNSPARRVAYWDMWFGSTDVNRPKHSSRTISARVT